VEPVTAETIAFNVSPMEPMALLSNFVTLREISVPAFPMAPLANPVK
jgi:hypothetical protein